MEHDITKETQLAFAQVVTNIAELHINNTESSVGAILRRMYSIAAIIRIINHWRRHKMKTDILRNLSELFLNASLTGKGPNWNEVANSLCADAPPPLKVEDLTQGDVLFAAGLIKDLVLLKDKFACEKHLTNGGYLSSRILIMHCYDLMGAYPIGREILSVILVANSSNYAEVIDNAIQYCTAAVLGHSLEPWYAALVAAAPIPVSSVE